MTSATLEQHWPHTFDGGRCPCGLVLITIKKGETAHPVHAIIAHHHATEHLAGYGYCDDCDAAIDEDGIALADILCAVLPPECERP